MSARTTPSRYSGWSSATTTVTRFRPCSAMLSIPIVRLGGHAAECDADGSRGATAYDGEGEGVPGSVTGENRGQLRGAHDLRAVDGDDGVAARERAYAVDRHGVGRGLQTCLCGRAALHDLDDHDAVRREPADGPRHGRVDLVDLDAEPGVLRVPARDQLLGDGSGRPSGDRESDADVPVDRAALDLRVDSDDVPGAVEERASRVAVVDRGVRLDRVGNGQDAGCLDLSANGADDPGGHGAIEPERASDRVHRIADLHRVRFERERMEGRCRRLDTQDRKSTRWDSTHQH